MKKEYLKPSMVDLSADEMMDVNGGGAVAVWVAVGIAVVVLLYGAVYTTAAGAVVVHTAGAINLVLGVNHVVNK